MPNNRLFLIGEPGIAKSYTHILLEKFRMENELFEYQKQFAAFQYRCE